MCQGKIKSTGKLCSRTNAEPYCWQHDPVKIEARRIERLTKSKDGFIYVYKHVGKEMFYKIGHTQREIEKRLKEWSAEDTKCTADLVLAFHVSDSVQMEKKLFKLLDDCRVYRYYISDMNEYCSIYKSSRKPVTSRDTFLLENCKLEGSKKRVEWFYGDFETAIAPVIMKEILTIHKTGEDEKENESSEESDDTTFVY